MQPENQQELYMRYECINFECQLNPTGYYVVSPANADDEQMPTCQHCGAEMIREDQMATNVLLWELGIDVEDDREEKKDDPDNEIGDDEETEEN